MMPHARWLMAMLLLAGCATGQSRAADPDPLAYVQAECEASARDDGSRALKAAMQYGGLAGVYLVLRGAASGAFWGAVTGGSASDGAWIGAAAGAGLGAIIGTVVGVEKSVDDRRRYQAAYEGCVASWLSREPGMAPPDEPRAE